MDAPTTVGRWSVSMDQRLKELIEDQLSASEIQARMGLHSRNQVIGRAHRLGIGINGGGPHKNGDHRPAVRRTKAIAARARTGKKYRLQYGFERPDPALLAPPTIHSEIPIPPTTPPARAHGAYDAHAELRWQDCRWPIGEPEDPDFHFCGACKKPGSPYCAPHNAVAHRKDKYGR